MKVLYVYVVIFGFFCYDHCASNAQGLQQLSYANADIGEKLIRSTVPTTTVSPVTTTTQKHGFFSGLRNIFSRSSTTNAPTTNAPRVLYNASMTSSPSQLSTLSTLTRLSSSTTKPTLAPVRLSTPPLPALQPSFSTTARPTPTTTTQRATSTTPQTTSTPYPTTKPTAVTPSTSTISYRNALTNSQQNVNSPSFPSVQQNPINSPVLSPIAFPTLSPNPSNGHHQNGGKYSRTSVTTHGPENGRNDANGVTDAELIELTEELFRKEKDDNLFNQINVNYQGRTHSSSITDEAKEPLLTLNSSILDTVPTIMKMRQLFNNYELDAAINEHVTPAERIEETDLADALLATPLMRKTMSFLQTKGKVTADVKTHRDLLKTIWFKLYSRGNGKIGSSGFEHVFLAELKKGEISGLHNWVYFYEEELSGHINYMGYIKKLDLGNKGVIIKLRFSYDGHIKPSNSIFIGTSPELEIALYTLCFQLRPDALCPVSLGGNQFNIRTYTFRYRGSNLIGSAFAEI